MQLKSDFAFVPLPPISTPSTPTAAPAPRAAAAVALPQHPAPDPLSPLRDLIGVWEGTGFNAIWRPKQGPVDHFLELNRTLEQIEFVEIPGDIPNRGLLQGDINMRGVRYLQQIQDAVVRGPDGNPAGLHIEPGIWAVVPPTSNPAEGRTVVRMASIPHGTTILAQGDIFTAAAPPKIVATSITPFVVGQPNNKIPFPADTNMSSPSPNRSPPNETTGITQAMVDDPNSILTAAIAHQTITQTTALVITTLPSAPILGGGTANTAFLQGGAQGPNAQASMMTATFWIETVKGAAGQPDSLQLQYTQTVLLNFAGLSLPHITVGTLHRSKPPARVA